MLVVAGESLSKISTCIKNTLLLPSHAILWTGKSTVNYDGVTEIRMITFETPEFKEAQHDSSSFHDRR